MGSIAKAVKRVIPKEIQPILPIAASMFAGPLVGAKLSGIGALATRPVLTQALASGLTSAGTDFLTSGKVDPKTLLTSTLMGAGGQYFKDVGAGSRGIMGLDLSDKAREQFSNIGNLMAPTGVDADTGKFDLSGDIIKSGSTAITAGGSIAAYNAAEEAQREYDEMMAGREADAAADRQSRIDYITRYMNMAGFSQAEIDDALGRAGYRTGGRVGFAKGGNETLGDSMQSIKILLMKNQIIEAGGGGFGGKDLDDKTDAEIIEIYEGLFGQGKANGGIMNTRIGYKIGGSTMQNIMARLLNIQVPDERLKEMRQNRADFLFNENVDAEDYPSQDYLNKVRDAAEKQATKELEEYMKKIGMDPLNPPEDSMSDKLIDQIMEPRKEGRVKEDGENQTPGQEVLKQLKDFDVLPPMDDMGYMDETMQRLLKSRSGKAEGGYEPPKYKYSDFEKEEYGSSFGKGSYYFLKDDPEAGTFSLEEVMEMVRESKGMKDGGIMDLKIGGMPAEMDLRGGGFVPIGAKEKADDVPARLSKNEFVMTADAVRAAGGGSVNKGAKRMYDLMNKLEARV